MNFLEICGIGFIITWVSIIGAFVGCMTTNPEVKYPPLWKIIICGPFMWMIVFVVYLQYRRESKYGT